jgi:cyclopropane fatty-acyl-phospholipid synthase-like methyltransferase
MKLKSFDKSLKQNQGANNDYDADKYIKFITHLYNDEYNNKELNFIIKNLNLTTEDKILDIPCGYGRLTNPLAKMVKEVIGVDINNYFLDIARQNSLNQSRKPIYIKEDVRDFKKPSYFDVVTVAFTSFGLFNDEDNLRFLYNISLNLKKAGRFAIEVLNPRYFCTNFYKESKCVIGQTMVVDKMSYNKNQQILSATREYTDLDATTNETHLLRVYRMNNLKSMLNRCGLKIAKTEYSLGIRHNDKNKSKLVLFGYKT